MEWMNGDDVGMEYCSLCLCVRVCFERKGEGLGSKLNYPCCHYSLWVSVSDWVGRLEPWLLVE